MGLACLMRMYILSLLEQDKWIFRRLPVIAIYFQYPWLSKSFLNFPDHPQNSLTFPWPGKKFHFPDIFPDLGNPVHFFQKYSFITGIYERSSLLKPPSKNSNPNCNYFPLKFVQLDFKLRPLFLFCSFTCIIQFWNQLLFHSWMPNVWFLFMK